VTFQRRSFDGPCGLNLPSSNLTLDCVAMMGDEKAASELMPPPPPPPVVVDSDNDGKEDEISMMDKLAIEKAEEKKLKEKYAQVSCGHWRSVLRTNLNLTLSN
jgi:hypothetical protein